MSPTVFPDPYPTLTPLFNGGVFWCLCVALLGSLCWQTNVTGLVVTPGWVWGRLRDLGFWGHAASGRGFWLDLGGLGVLGERGASLAKP